MSQPNRVLIIGTFDSKPTEFQYLRERVLSQGCEVLTMNVGVLEAECPFPVDIVAADVSIEGGQSIETLRSKADRGAAMQCMSIGAARVIAELHRQSATDESKKFDAVVGMGGSGGTSIITAAMRALPLGIPKVCVTTVASSNTVPYVGSKDVVLIPSITDVAGLNRISRRVIAQAAAAVCGMASINIESNDGDRPIIVASMFGNTTDCLSLCREQLDEAGYETLIFHAVGSGGRTLETLVADGLADGCLDITTTEWADELCGGIFAAGEDRLAAAGRKGVPHLIAPGCIDMVNFGPMDSVPAKYREANRLFYEWNPTVTLMRTNVEENRRLGEIFAEKANAATGPIGFLLPLRGVSILDGDGERFCDREADQAMFESLKSNLRSDIPVIEVDANINDPIFARQAVDTMLAWLQETKREAKS